MRISGQRLAIGIGLVSLLAAALLVPRPVSGDPLDPRSPGPAGTKAVLDTMRELGHEVHLDGVDEADTLVLFSDELSDADRDDLLDDVRSGARLVLTDPFSTLARVRVAGQAATDPIGATRRSPDCEWAALSEVGEISAGRWLDLRPLDGSEPSTFTCFPVGDGHGLVQYAEGLGEVIVLSAPGALTNLRLGDADNAVLATALLARSADSVIAVVPASPPGEGDVALMDLVPDRVWLALAIAVLLFVLVAWERGRRLGRPVDEAMPVRVPGSELVHAVGALMGRADASEAAARTIRREAIRDLARLVGTDPHVSVDVLAARVADGRDIDPEAVASLLASPVTTPDQLLAVQSGLARVQSRLRQTPATAPSHPPTVPPGDDL